MASEILSADGGDDACYRVQRHCINTKDVRHTASRRSARVVCRAFSWPKHRGISVRLSCARRPESGWLPLYDVWKEHSAGDYGDHYEMVKSSFGDSNGHENGAASSVDSSGTISCDALCERREVLTGNKVRKV